MDAAGLLSHTHRTSEAWDATHPVGEPLARALLTEQFPHIDVTSLEPIGSGWDNDLWRAGAWAFRFPRREIGVAFIDTEIRVLPSLASRLPLSIPRPVWVGCATSEYPSAFYGHAFLEGDTVEHHTLSEEERAACADPLGHFLRALHGIPRDEVRDMGVLERSAASDMARLKARAMEDVGRLRAGGLGRDMDAAEELLRDCPPACSEAQWTVIHADFHARHIILDPTQRPTGVLDWGDICVGDPAVDLSIAYTFFSAATRERFFEAYGPVDSATRRRARHVGLTRYGMITLDYAIETAKTALEKETRWSLACCL